MSDAKGLKLVGYLDCPGGGQVVVDGTTAYVAHIKGPEATSVIDVADPSKPKLTEHFELPWKVGVHSHKVRVKDGLMLTNIESTAHTGPVPDDYVGGLNIYDASDALKPKLIHTWHCAARGIHRFTFDGRYAYISPCIEGYRQNIVMILDLKNPDKPEEVGRWWYPGQWEAGGEETTWADSPAIVPRCHHPIRLGDRLYVSYWHGGWVILDISDMSKPSYVSGMDWSPPFAYPAHTCLPIPFDIEGRRIMLVTDEDALPKWKDAPGSLLWLVDITVETNPVPFSTWRVAGLDGGPVAMHATCHQPAEDVKGTEIPVAYFEYGVRIVDIADPHRIEEVAHYMPDPHPDGTRVASNDVCWDDRGLIYVIDRVGGLSILERV